jgi:hypothetical protein
MRAASASDIIRAPTKRGTSLTPERGRSVSRSQLRHRLEHIRHDIRVEHGQIAVYPTHPVPAHKCRRVPFASNRHSLDPRKELGVVAGRAAKELCQPTLLMVCKEMIVLGQDSRFGIRVILKDLKESEFPGRSTSQ